MAAGGGNQRWDSEKRTTNSHGLLANGPQTRHFKSTTSTHWCILSTSPVQPRHHLRERSRVFLYDLGMFDGNMLQQSFKRNRTDKCSRRLLDCPARVFPMKIRHVCLPRPGKQSAKASEHLSFTLYAEGSLGQAQSSDPEARRTPLTRQPTPTRPPYTAPPECSK